MHAHQLFCPSLSIAIGLAYDMPPNLQALYDKHKPGRCTNVLAKGFSPGGGDSDHSFAYCGDIDNAIYIHSRRNTGQYVDMDIDCDGATKCTDDGSWQGQTAFMDTLQSYGIDGVTDLDANIHPYVVFGNEGSDPHFTEDEFEAQGISSLSVMAVICNGQLHFGVWGDTNGGTLVGESSLAMGNLCFPDDGLSGNNGHVEKDVMYIAFKNGVNGLNTVPGRNGANWKAGSPQEFEDSVQELGQQLVAALSDM